VPPKKEAGHAHDILAAEGCEGVWCGACNLWLASGHIQLPAGCDIFDLAWLDIPQTIGLAGCSLLLSAYCGGAQRY